MPLEYQRSGSIGRSHICDGNSLALVIDRPILDLLRFDADTALEISTYGKRLIIAASGPSLRRTKFEAAQAEATAMAAACLFHL